MIKKGLKVKIISGKDKNKEGVIIEIDRRNNRAKIKGIKLGKIDKNANLFDLNNTIIEKKIMIEATIKLVSKLFTKYLLVLSITIILPETDIL